MRMVCVSWYGKLKQQTLRWLQLPSEPMGNPLTDAWSGTLPEKLVILTGMEYSKEKCELR